MSEELEKIGVDVWIAGTIYVDAKTDEEARKIVSERHAGTRDDAGTYDHMNGEDLPLDGDDFMSSAITLYGLCSDSELFPAVDPVRDAAPDMLQALKACAPWIAKFIADGHHLSCVMPKAAIEAMQAANGAIAKAEGRK